MENLTDNLKNHVKSLVDIYPRNARSFENCILVEDYIFNQFKSYGFEPSKQNVLSDGKTYHNIIAVFNPEGERTIILGAHYDSEGQDPEKVSPGADDNASGIAGLLETARLFMKENPLIEDRIEFVAYCNGEPPYHGTTGSGSYIHADALKKDKRKVAVMVCLKMIGYFSDTPASQIRRYLPEGLRDKVPMRGDFIAVTGKFSQAGPVEDFVQKIKASSSIPAVALVDRSFDSQTAFSDHTSYWKHGFTAFMVTDTAQQRNLNYHTMNDKIETLNFDKMNLVVQGVFGALKKWARQA